MPKKKEIVEGTVLKEKKVEKGKKEKVEKEKVKQESKSKVEPVKEKQDSQPRKAYFFPRLIAYIIDFTIVTLILSFILVFVPANNNYDDYLKEYEQIQMDYLENKITSDEYINKSVEVVYDLDYSNVMSMVIGVVVFILYFSVFQFYNKGQTLGKKLMKIRVVSDNPDSKLSMNQYIFRSLIINSLACKILIIGMVLFMSRDIYYYASLSVQGIQMILVIVCAFMVIYSASGRGLHDRIAGTRVVMDD